MLRSRAPAVLAALLAQGCISKNPPLPDAARAMDASQRAEDARPDTAAEHDAGLPIDAGPPIDAGEAMAR